MLLGGIFSTNSYSEMDTNDTTEINTNDNTVYNTNDNVIQNSDSGVSVIEASSSSTAFSETINETNDECKLNISNPLIFKNIDGDINSIKDIDGDKDSDGDKDGDKDIDNIMTTENGAISLDTTMDPRLDLFYKTIRNSGNLDIILPLAKILREKNYKLQNDKKPNLSLFEFEGNQYDKIETNEPLYELINKSWEVNKLDTLKIIFNWRDCRGGKGDHEGFIVAFNHIINNFNYPEDTFTNKKLLELNIDNIVKYGCYLDLIKLWHCFKIQNNNVCARHIMEYIVKQLKEDKSNLDKIEAGNTSDVKISLLAKWIPSENRHWDFIGFIPGGLTVQKNDDCRFYNSLCKEMFMHHKKITKMDELKKTLRKNYLVPLRKYLKIVETNITSKDFSSINYEEVPSVAMKKHSQTFCKYDYERFRKYLNDVRCGEKKINSSQVYPHDLVRVYLENETDLNDVVEEQWRVIAGKVHSSGVFNNSLVVCDVSRSMSGTPMEVAIALGILGMNNRKIITFSETAEIHTVNGDTLRDQVANVRNMRWGMNTNFEAVCDKILNWDTAITKVFIFSDMQFDNALNNSNQTHFKRMKQEFEKVGKKMPTIIFWNLRGDTKDFPVKKNDNGVVLLSGYSPSLLNALLDGEEVTPINVMLKIINNPRYDSVVIN